MGAPGSGDGSVQDHVRTREGLTADRAAAVIAGAAR
jgi:hypothetical protein